jgi:hypothetical protein
LLLPQAKTDTSTTAATGTASVASESAAAVGTVAAASVSWRENFLFKPLKSSSAKLVVELRYRKNDLSKDKVSAVGYCTNSSA